MTIARRLQSELIPGEILSVQVGMSRTAVLARTGEGIRCGLAATLSNPEFSHHRRPSVIQAGHLHRLEYTQLAAMVESPSYTEVSIGLATINALLPRRPEAWLDLNAEDYLLEHGAGRKVAMVGHFPVVERLRAVAGQLWVLELKPRDGDLPAQAAPEVVPQADLVAITGTTLINHTFDGLISLCRPGATVVMLGPSTPLSPLLFEYGIHVVSGAIVEDPQTALLAVGQGASLRQLRQAGCVRLVTLQKEYVP
ncbi:MAG: DUF364 domain-containing protein [Anaerolineaceae bacterium]|jgi:uncharacterized protein (DUF4213/DUF364 family)|nr:DUF364 domain-containing protein [Anaerolineaceae bacterium]